MAVSKLVDLKEVEDVVTHLYTTLSAAGFLLDDQFEQEVFSSLANPKVPID